VKHAERLKIANETAKEIIRRYGKNNILSIGIYGSVARNEDDEFSDLEMIAIIKRKEFFKHYFFKGIIVSIDGLTFKNAIKTVRKVDCEWSLKSSKLLYQKIIYGNKSIINKFDREIKSVKDSDLRKAAEEQISWMFDSLSKIKNANKTKNLGKMLVPVAFYTIQVNLFIGILNKYIYKRQYFDSIEEAKNLKKLPKNYYKLMMILYTSTDLDKVTKAATQLFNNCSELLR
jgi:predicted nucleotidyltransferase